MCTLSNYSIYKINISTLLINYLKVPLLDVLGILQ